MFSMDDDTSFVSTTKNDKLFKLSCETIEGLYNKYENDLFMTSKIHHYITQQLPTVIDNISQVRDKNTIRIQECSEEQNKFVSKYLSKYLYFYNQTTENYFLYSDSFYVKNEQDVLHHIVSSISEERNTKLMQWKYKTTQTILKKIKDNSIFNVIPNSNTIQNVLQYMNRFVCNTRVASKYLLCILGDNIKKKQNHLCHYITSSGKPFLKKVNQTCVHYFGVSCLQTCKYKYHEKHEETQHDCRIVPFSNDTWQCEDSFYNIALDLLCVACYYSNRYNNSDSFLNDRTDDVEFQNFVMKISLCRPEKIVREFADAYLIAYGNHTPKESLTPQDEYFLQNHFHPGEEEIEELSGKEMQYLWNDFLLSRKYPPQMYSNIYKKILSESIFDGHYNEESDIFKKLGSSQLPLIHKFLQFWGETIMEDTSEYAELEIDEVSQLFKMWLYKCNKKIKQTLKESKMINILQYFNPDTEIAENKYILHKRCAFWDKETDIDNTVHLFLENEQTMNVHEAYSFYTKQKHKTPLVSKSYFEKYFMEKYNYS